MTKQPTDTVQVRRIGTRTIEVVASNKAAAITVNINSPEMETLDEHKRKDLETVIEAFCQVLVKVVINYRPMYRDAKVDTALPLIILLKKLAKTVKIIADAKLVKAEIADLEQCYVSYKPLPLFSQPQSEPPHVAFTPLCDVLVSEPLRHHIRIVSVKLLI